jgi:RNA polymerase sigma factor (sigma-70 family)
MVAVCDPDPAARRHAWNELVESYWRPVYKYLRWRWGEGSEEAADLTQEFFTAAFGGRLMERFDPARARFRTYLRLCLDGFVLNQRKAAGRMKRGGGWAPLPLDYAGAEAELAAARPFPAGAGGEDPEELFHREWVRSLFGLAVADLRRQCEALGHGVQLAIFERYDLAGVDTGALADAGAEPGRPSYARLAAELGVPVTQVTNHLAAVRRRFRGLVLQRLRRMTASEGELRAEARVLLGIELGTP